MFEAASGGRLISILCLISPSPLWWDVLLQKRTCKTSQCMLDTRCPDHGGNCRTRLLCTSQRRIRTNSNQERTYKTVVAMASTAGVVTGQKSPTPRSKVVSIVSRDTRCRIRAHCCVLAESSAMTKCERHILDHRVWRCMGPSKTRASHIPSLKLALRESHRPAALQLAISRLVGSATSVALVALDVCRQRHAVTLSPVEAVQTTSLLVIVDQLDRVGAIPCQLLHHGDAQLVTSMLFLFEELRT